MMKYAVTFVLLIFLCGSFVSVECSSPQSTTVVYESLVQFYQEMGGEHWHIPWEIDDMNFCYWYGLECIYDDNGTYLVTMSMLQNNITGILPPSICQLTDLVVIDLSRNSIYGSFPDCFSNLINLRTLYLYTTELTGSIPACIGALPSLVNLDFTYTTMSGDLQNDILCNLTNIHYFGLGTNTLTGTIDPCLCNLPYLDYIILSESYITGSIPSCFSQLSNMLAFWVEDNLLTGPLPDISNWTWIIELDVSYNQLEGPLPDLSNNLLLNYLNFQGNSLNGTLPDSLCDLVLLTDLGLQNNEFEGTIPSCLGNLLHLNDLQISSNQLIGTIPEELGNLTNLRYFLVSNNGLVGTLPDTFTNLTNLLWLDISSNPFGVDIYDLIHPVLDLPNLMYLSIANTSLYGGLEYPIFYDDQIANECFKNLAFMDMHNNFLTGTIPVIITWWERVIQLDISQNLFTGELPLALGRFYSVKVDGNPYLTSPNGSPPSFLIPDYNHEVINITGNFECPSMTGLKPDTSFTIDSSYYNYSICECNGNYFGVNGTCIPCLDHASCPGGGLLHITAGYYPSPSIDNPQTLIECAKVGLTFTPCNPSGGYPFECAAGYTDRKCAKCAPSHYSFFGRCELCTGQYKVISAIFVPLLLILFSIFIILIRPYFPSPSPSIILPLSKHYSVQELFPNSEELPLDRSTTELKPKSSPTSELKNEEGTLSGSTDSVTSNTVYSFGTFKIAVLYCQMVSAVLSIHFPWPEMFQYISLGIGAANLDIMGVLGFQCALTDPTNYVHTFYLYMSLPCILLACGMLFYVVGQILGKFTFLSKAQTQLLIHDFIRFELFCLMFCYFPISKQVLNIFNCETDPITHLTYISSAPYQLCDINGDYGKLLSGAIVLLLVYIIGLPAGLFLLLWKKRKTLMEPTVRMSFGFIYEPFSDKTFWFEIFLMMRSLLLSIAISLISITSAFHNFFIAAFLLIAFLIQMKMSPFRHAMDNHLETMSLFCVILTFVAGMIFDSNATSGGVTTVGSEDTAALGWVVVVVIFIVFVTIVVFIVGRVFDRVGRSVAFIGKIAQKIKLRLPSNYNTVSDNSNRGSQAAWN